MAGKVSRENAGVSRTLKHYTQVKWLAGEKDRFPVAERAASEAEAAGLPETIQIGGLEIRFLESGASTTEGGLDVFEMTVQPNARVPVPHHHEIWEETIYGLVGELTFRIGGQDVIVGPGQTAFIPCGVVHGFRNDGHEVGKCLCILTPGVLGPGYFREMATLLSQTPPDLTQIKETMLRYGLIPAPPAPVE